MLQKFNVDVEMQLIRLDNIIEQKDLTKKENSNKILKYYKSLNKEKLNNIYLWLFSGFKNCVLEINKEFTFKFNAKNNLILFSNVTYYIKGNSPVTNKQLHDIINENFSQWSNAGDESFTLKKFKIKKVTYYSDNEILEITNRTLIN